MMRWAFNDGEATLQVESTQAHDRMRKRFARTWLFARRSYWRGSTGAAINDSEPWTMFIEANFATKFSRTQINA